MTGESLQARRPDLWGLAISGPGKSPPASLWVEDARFLAIMRDVEHVTKVEWVSCYLLYQLTQHALGVPGDLAEVGVYRGGSAKLMATVLAGSSKTLHLFDTFQGMPASDAGLDGFQAGAFADTSVAQVEEQLAGYRNYRIYAGLFPQTAAEVGGHSFALVHIDADIHRSVHEACKFFFPRMSKGGALIFDDYGYPKCGGARIAVNDYFEKLGVQPIYLPTGQALVIKA